MGAVAINRKRSEESFNFNHHQSTNPLRHSPYIQASKKRRFSVAMSEDSGKPASSSNPTISRISRYPDAKAPLRREIHAPSRGLLRFGSFARSSVPERKTKPNDYCEKGNFFVRNYDIAKRTALEALRYVKKDKDFIDLGDEPEKEAISEDSSVEVVEVVECDEENLVEEKTLQPCSSSFGVTDVENGNNLRVDDTGVMLDSLSLDREENDASSLEAYKKLLQSAERRNSRIEALGFEIVLNEKRMSKLRQSRPTPVEKPKQVIRFKLFFLELDDINAAALFGLILDNAYNVIAYSCVVRLKIVYLLLALRRIDAMLVHLIGH